MHGLEIWPPGGATGIGGKFGHKMKPLASVANLATRWQPGPSVLRNFNPGWDRIFAKSWDPGFFWDRINQIFSSHD